MKALLGINNNDRQDNVIELSSMLFAFYIILNVILTPLVNAATNCEQVTEIPKAECNTLVALYNSTNGSSWFINTNWTITDTPCSWYGVTCNGGHVQQIYLSSNRLSGTVPDLSALTQLTALELSGNNLVHTATDCNQVKQIPKEECEALVALYNNTSSEGWMNQTNWNTVNMPCTWYGVSCNGGHVQQIYLSSNGLSGTVPDLSALTQLTFLELSGNNLVYTATDCNQVKQIPKEECETLVALYNNTNGKEWMNNANWNTVSVPCTWYGVSCNGGHMQQIHLPSNRLSGTVPDLSALTQLTALYLYDNNLVYTATDCNQVKQIPKEECETLVALYNNTNGKEWINNTNWNTVNVPCTWYGVNCNDEHVKGLTLYANGLNGTIPDLSALTQLISLELSNNQLNGAIPNLDALIQLMSLSLSNNQLSGSIPDFNALTQLTSLNLANNQLSGVIPDLSTLTQLTYLDFSMNQLSDAIPDFSTLTQLTFLGLSGNQLSGIIPDLSTLIQLTTLSLSNNRLSGTIPDLSALTQLTTLSLSNNQLDGAVPDLSMLTQLALLDLYGNNLVYTAIDCNQVKQIPKEECETLVALYNNTNGKKWINNANWNIVNAPCSWYGVGCSDGHVQQIFLNSNGLSGSLPNLNNLTRLEYLYLNTNQLSGAIPDLAALTQLQELNLSYNQFHGTIPDLDELTRLRSLYLNDNQLTGIVPDLGALTQLTALNLSNNNLIYTTSDCNQVKQIPKEECETLVALYDATNGTEWINNANWKIINVPCQWYGVTCYNGHVQQLTLNFNGLSGSLPDLNNLTQLQVLNLSYNNLNGALPNLNALTQLQKIVLYNNHFSGPIPDLSALTQLQSLILFNNQLSGNFPDLSMIPQLRELYLSDNQLCGDIPLWLSRLSSFYSVISFNNNHLTLPTDTMLINFLNDHYIDWKDQYATEVCQDASVITSTNDVNDMNNFVITGLNKCHASSIIDVMCSNYGDVISDTVIGEHGNIAGGDLGGVVENHGIVSQVNILPDAVVNGGRMTGYIVNQGSIIDVEFIGAELRGGIVGGTFINHSRVGGVLRDVQLMGGARVIGGVVAGFIQGDMSNPALLEDVTIRSGTVWSGVTLGNGVTIQ